MLLNPPEPISKKSCPVARQVEMFTVISAGSSFCKPTLKFVVLATVNSCAIPATFILLPSPYGNADNVT